MQYKSPRNASNASGTRFPFGMMLPVSLKATLLLSKKQVGEAKNSTYPA